MRALFVSDNEEEEDFNGFHISEIDLASIFLNDSNSEEVFGFSCFTENNEAENYDELRVLFESENEDEDFSGFNIPETPDLAFTFLDDSGIEAFLGF